MTSAETKKAPVAPTTGTTAEAAPTAPTNTEFIANETDKTMIASPTDNRQRLESVVTTASKCGALISRHFLDADVLRRVESGDLPVSSPGAAAVLRAIIDTAEEPASSAIDFCSEV